MVTPRHTRTWHVKARIHVRVTLTLGFRQARGGWLGWLVRQTEAGPRGGSGRVVLVAKVRLSERGGRRRANKGSRRGGGETGYLFHPWTSPIDRGVLRPDETHPLSARPPRSSSLVPPLPSPPPSSPPDLLSLAFSFSLFLPSKATVPVIWMGRKERVATLDGGGWMWQSATPEGLSRRKCGEHRDSSLRLSLPPPSPPPSVPYSPSPFHSFHFHLSVSPSSPSPRPPHTCRRCRLLLRRVARRGLRRNGGGVVVAWTEINIRRASTYSCPLARAQPASLMFVSPRVRVLVAPASNFGHVPRPSNRGDPVVASLSRSLSRPPYRPPYIPLSLEGGLTHVHGHRGEPYTCEGNASARARALANQPFLYRVCFDV